MIGSIIIIGEIWFYAFVGKLGLYVLVHTALHQRRNLIAGGLFGPTRCMPELGQY